MARRFGKGVVKELSLSAATTKTALQLIAATNHAIVLTELDVSFNGVNNTHEPVLVEIVRQTSAGSSAALTLRKADAGISDTLDTTGLQTFSSEPTDGGDIPFAEYIHPQTGHIYQLSDLDPIIVAAGERIGVRLTAPNAVSCNVKLAFEE